MARPLYVIAKDIAKDWKPIHPHALPYFRALESLDSIDDNFMFDSADMVVRYFLSNARTWKGEVAKEIKKELNAMLK
jgi:hypothetical protein